MTAAGVLEWLLGAGVEVIYDPPDRIRLRGVLTDEMIEAARAAKDELLELVRPRPRVHACACCGRFYFAEPSTICYWCRPARTKPTRDPENTLTKPTEPGVTGNSVGFVRVNSGERAGSRACPRCGGGLHRGDPHGAECWSCRRLRGPSEGER
jgi:hypothetical protein